MPITLSVAVYKALPYVQSSITAEFDSEDRDSFIQSLRQKGFGSRLACHDDGGAIVFLTTPSIRLRDEGAEGKIRRWMGFFVANYVKGEIKGGIEVDGKSEGNFIAWLPSKSLEQISASARLEGFSEGSGINCFVLPISLLPQPASDSGDESVVRDNKTRQRITENIINLLTEVKTTSPFDLQNTQTATKIVYPSLHTYTGPPGEWTSESRLTLTFRGRSVLGSEIIPTLHQLHSYFGFWEYSLSGTYGAGINYLAIGATVSLLAQGYPVVFIPYTNGKPRLSVIRDAILLALSNVDHGLERADQVFDYCTQGMMGFIRFCNHMTSKRIRFIFVILDIDKATKDEYRELRQLMLGHVSCFTVHPNSEYRRMYENVGVRCLFLEGALFGDELEGWWAQYQAEASPLSIDDETRDIILTFTGGVPGLLEVLFAQIKKTKCFKMDYLVPHPDMYKDLEQCMTALTSKHPERIRIREGTIAAAINNLPYYEPGPCMVDQRFIYQEEDGRRTCSSLAVLKVVRTYSLTLSNFARQVNIRMWLSVIPRIRQNRVMLGFAVEYALSIAISQNGLNLIRMQRHLWIPSGLSMSPLSVTAPQITKTSQIYVPTTFNYRNIDFIIVWFDGSAKTVWVCPVQVSIVTDKSKHADSCANFFKNDWSVWASQITDLKKDWEIKWNFVWVLDIEKSRNSCTFHVGSNSHPAYVEWVVDFDTVNEDVGDALKIAHKCT
ncbi:hypothetical protein GYMLUDRAFT_260383 [Collybiopsis luxurians FD-317 M1]|uniref:Uncharacterized protein n=1 Tax=Collybiopsis luxurians FD-317 M1 TaxID=944289 RepID=A0A0D0CHV8_9AGAR|nr:hypothetical protein GYMLUDRAFT_260383 [Collybiopsis luxurians FD-317 M1]